MNELQIFNNEEFGSIRTLMIDDEPWFVGKDVATALGYSNPQKAVRNHVDEEDKGVNEMGTPGGTQNITIINESGLYSLILSSKLESAKRFKHWVTSEVLPSIRKNGGYIAGQETLTDEQLIAKALVVAHKVIEQKDKKIDELEIDNLYKDLQIADMEPKVSYYEKILNSPEAIRVTTIAQDYDMTPVNFNKMLHSFGIQYKFGKNSPWVLYKDYLGNGYTTSVVHSFKFGATRSWTCWTQKGRLFLYNFLKERGILPVIEREGMTS